MANGQFFVLLERSNKMLKISNRTLRIYNGTLEMELLNNVMLKCLMERKNGIINISNGMFKRSRILRSVKSTM